MDDKELILPRQPFFLNATHHYKKYVINNFGISHFYSFIADDMDISALGIPDYCVDIMYCLDSKNPDIVLCGTGFSPRPLKLKLGNRYFGVRFLPGFIPKFKSISFSEIITKDIIFEELMHDEKSFDAIVNTTDFCVQIKTFMEEYYRKYMIDTDYDHDLKNYIRNEIVYNHGCKPLKMIADDAGYSDRYITKVFKANYGMTPKKFSEIIKFQYLLQKMQEHNSPQISFMYIAMDCDYYDESHMIRSCRKYINETPKEYYEFVHSDVYNNKLDII